MPKQPWKPGSSGKDPRIDEYRVIVSTYEVGYRSADTHLTFRTMEEVFAYCLAQGRERVDSLTVVGVDELGEERLLNLAFLSLSAPPRQDVEAVGGPRLVVPMAGAPSGAGQDILEIPDTVPVLEPFVLEESPADPPSGACAVCGDPLASRPIRSCPACEAPLHDECRLYVGGCARFGCSLSPRQRIR